MIDLMGTTEIHVGINMKSLVPPSTRGEGSGKFIQETGMVRQRVAWKIDQTGNTIFQAQIVTSQN